VLLHYFVKRKRSKITNCAKIAIKPYHVKFSHTFNNQLLIFSQNLRKASFFDLHTSSQIRVPLVIVAGKVVYVSAGQRLLTQCLRTLSGFSVSVAATTRVHITTSNNLYLWQYQYHVYQFRVQNVNELKKHLLVTAWNLLLTVQ